MARTRDFKETVAARADPAIGRGASALAETPAGLASGAERRPHPGDRYFVDPGLLRGLKLTRETTLKRIEPNRLATLVLEDLQRYPESAISDIRKRVGGEIHPKQIKRALEELIERGAVRFEGNYRWRRYWAVA
jgi:hypothetical protein